MRWPELQAEPRYSVGRAVRDTDRSGLQGQGKLWRTVASPGLAGDSTESRRGSE